MGLGIVIGLRIEIQGVDGVVGQQVAVVEEQAVQTDAGGQLEAVVDVPLVLAVDAGLVELHAGGRLLLAVVAVGEVDDLRGGTCEEVAHGIVAVVTGTIAHVLVVSHLVLEAGTCGDLVVAHVVGQVVLDVGHGVVHGVVPGEELIAEGHVDVRRGAFLTDVAVEDVDVRELGGVGAADVIQLGPGGEELVGQVVAQAAVEVEGHGVDDVLHRVHRVGEGHGVLRHTGAGHTGAAVHGGGVGRAPAVVERVVVADGKLVLVVDVPVDAGQDLHVVLVGREVSPGTGVIAVLALHELGDALQVGDGGTGDEVVRIGLAVGGAVPAVHDRRGHRLLEVGEEEELVLDDRAAQGEAVGGVAVPVAGAADLLAVHGVAAEVLVAVIDVGRALEGVGTGLGDGVDAAADEVGLADIIRGDHHLHLLDGVDGDRVAAAGQAVGQAEVVVEVGAVHGEVGGTTVSSGESHAVAAVRGKAGHVGDAAADRRQGRDLAAVDVGGSAGLLGCKLGGGFGDDNGLAQHLGVIGKGRVERVGFRELEGDVRVGHGVVAQAADFNGVRAAGTHTVDEETALGVGHSIVLRAGGRVDCHDGGAGDGLSLLVGHLAVQRRSRHLRSGRHNDEHCRQRQQHLLDSLFHHVDNMVKLNHLSANCIVTLLTAPQR